MSPDQEFRQAAAAVADRLRVFRQVARGARECEQDRIDLDLREFWESADEDALDKFDQAVERLTGQVRLPMEVAS